eukprot:7446182-Lingulodinium_polyedra.AAC.1
MSLARSSRRQIAMPNTHPAMAPAKNMGACWILNKPSMASLCPCKTTTSKSGANSASNCNALGGEATISSRR